MDPLRLQNDRSITPNDSMTREGDIALSVTVFKEEGIVDRKYLDDLPRFYRL